MTQESVFKIGKILKSTVACSGETLHKYGDTIYEAGIRDGWDVKMYAGLRIHIDDSIEFGLAILVTDRWMRDNNLYCDDAVEYDVMYLAEDYILQDQIDEEDDDFWED